MSRKLNILLTFPNTNKGGAFVTALQAAEILSKRNNVVFLIGGKKYAEAAKFYGCNVSKVKFVVYSGKEKRHLTNLLEPLLLWSKMNALVKKIKFNIFIDFGGTLLNGFLAKFYNLPSLATFHEFTQGTNGGWLSKIYYKLFLLLSKLALSGFSIISTNSKYTQRTFYQNFGITPIVRYPLVTDYFFKRKANGLGNYVLCLCRIAKHKNLENLISAYKKMHTDVPFLIVGSVTDRNYLEDLKNTAKGRNIQFLTNVSRESVLDIMKQAKVFWYGYGYEWFGLVLAEAQALGLPIVTFGGGAPSEIVLDGKTGFVVKSEEEMAKKTELLLKDRHLWQKMSASAKNAASRFSPKEFERKLYETMELALNKYEKT